MGGRNPAALCRIAWIFEWERGADPLVSSLIAPEVSQRNVKSTRTMPTRLALEVIALKAGQRNASPMAGMSGGKDWARLTAPAQRGR